MIHSVSANIASFRTVSFETGLNVIIAERTETSSKKDTCNGLGKSTLLDIIDFCLGGSAKTGKKLIIDPLKEWVFTLEATVAGNRVKISRAVSSHNRIVIEGDTEGWCDQPDLDDDTAEHFFNLTRWRKLLGWALFGLSPNDETYQHKPTYRSLISYFIRTKPGAYITPFKYLPQQKGIIAKVNIAYLLDLGWENVSKIEELEETRLGLNALSKGKVSGVSTIGELEAERVQLEQNTNALAQSIESFLVHPEYHEIQEEADQLTSEIHGLTNENISDKRKLYRYKESIADVLPANTEALEQLYKESGLVFSGDVKRTLSQAKEFHESIITNRREFLEREISRIESSITDRESQIALFTQKRAKLLKILETHGALQEMTKLQERNTLAQNELNKIQSRIDELKSISKQKREIKAQKAEAVKIAEQDHEDRRKIWENAIRLFNDNTQALYKTPGKLIIDIDDKGYSYEVEIDRTGSDGIDKMKIFCFDLALLQLQLEKQDQIDFLIHDTLMYDAVDPRQRAMALARAAEITSANSAQYICTMNSDMVPFDDFPEDFDFDQYVRLRLTDKSDSGRLLGIQFDRPGTRLSDDEEDDE